MCSLVAVPTYAVVDKSAKKSSKKDKKVEEEKPQAAPPEYAAVDKSKKKKKEEPEATYAEVDKSKKSKKVCQWLTVFFLYVFADWIHNIADSAFMLTPGSIFTLSAIEYVCTILTEIRGM